MLWSRRGGREGGGGDEGGEGGGGEGGGEEGGGGKVRRKTNENVPDEFSLFHFIFFLSLPFFFVRKVLVFFFFFEVYFQIGFLGRFLLVFLFQFRHLRSSSWPLGFGSSGSFGFTVKFSGSFLEFRSVPTPLQLS